MTARIFTIYEDDLGAIYTHPDKTTSCGPKRAIKVIKHDAYEVIRMDLKLAIAVLQRTQKHLESDRSEPGMTVFWNIMNALKKIQSSGGGE